MEIQRENLEFVYIVRDPSKQIKNETNELVVFFC